MPSKVFLPRALLLVFLSTFIAPAAWGQGARPQSHANWRTPAERTDYRETPTYDETLAFIRRLEAASPWVRLTFFGRSGEGRQLPLVLAAKGSTFTPQSARASGKPVVLVQACIHAGESDGKDAGLALLRDVAVTKSRAELLDRVVLLFIPVYNVDGHERRSPYNRINQNGPREMGRRSNATNLNLNRDYVKADAPETRAWLRLWNLWSPDLFIDCHVTDGADYRYNVTHQYERHENVMPTVRAWAEDFFERRVFPAAEASGSLLSPYLVFRDNRDPSKGIEGFVSTPRFATAYAPVLRNRPALLIETHMLKDHRTRVQGTYDVLAASLAEVNRNPQGLLRAVREADEEVVREGKTYDAGRKVALSVELTDRPRTITLKGFESRTERSDVSGAERVIWTDRPADIHVPFYDDARASRSVAPPLFYVVPPQWAEVIDLLALHGVRFERLRSPLTAEVESYRLREPRWSPRSFEGRRLVTFKTEPLKERRTFPAGSVLVPLAQPNARVALHLLEPEAPDSLVAWGFFDAIFEQKEYGEDYMLEKLAREMLAKDEKLKREFEARLASDEKFAASPRERLNFFYERSPYWDRSLGVYPVARLTSPPSLRTADRH
jgi:murein tripeptide amidase MpaA